MFDQGSGTPIVVVQPLQGRWQWTRPLLLALSQRARAVSYTLSGDFGSGRNGAVRSFADYVAQLRDVMDAAGVREAALCGVSFGGAVAARFAAEFPERATHLVIASSPGPGWRPNEVQERYVAHPWLSMPAFTIGALGRTGPEIAAALQTLPARARFTFFYGVTAVRYPMMPHLMARRVRLLERADLAEKLERVTARTLVVTGEPHLDRIVPVASTKRYAELIKGAQCVTMERTGHLGALTQPERFAELVSGFVNGKHS